MTALRFSLLPHRGVLAVGGPDRVSFLQGLVSNDITKVAADRAIWAALLTPQGRFLNDMFVVDGGNDTLLLETERERAPALARKLSLYKLRSKVTVEDRGGQTEVAAIFSADSGPAVPPPCPGTVCYADPRLAQLGWRLLAPAGQARSLLAAQGLCEVPLAAYESLRLELGVPDGSRDLPVEKALLLESGFDELNGVDWQKGCYMGQELTARTKYRGLIKRRLFPVEIEGEPPAAGTPVQRDGQEVGEIRSGDGRRALALLQLEAARSEAPLKAGQAVVRPFVPAWMRLP
ncbi:MAG: hypothetical protein U1E23_04830 [Reyranellaceae bacterium]